MSREIKFRAWHQLTARMYYFVELGFCREYNLLSFTWDGDKGDNYCAIPDWNKENYDVMQFTGLEDKNGNNEELCQGDIIATGNPVDGVFYIDWNDRKAQWYLYDENNHVIFPLWDALSETSCKYKKVGNIHENPELLGNGKEKV